MYCTWYFWRYIDTLYVSPVEHYNEDEKVNKDVYLNHMKKTLVLIIAAIHQKSPSIYGRALRPLDLIQFISQSSISSEVSSFRHAVASRVWKSLVSYWSWVWHFKTKYLSILSFFLALVPCFEDIPYGYVWGVYSIHWKRKLLYAAQKNGRRYVTTLPLLLTSENIQLINIMFQQIEQTV